MWLIVVPRSWPWPSAQSVCLLRQQVDSATDAGGLVGDLKKDLATPSAAGARQIGRDRMITKLRVRTLAVALLLLWALARPAAAQVSTGTVSGTVKDVQGGVIPGATVTLISEAQGT